MNTETNSTETLIAPPPPEVVESPFGFESNLTQTIATSVIIDMYRRKCGINIKRALRGHPFISLYTCKRTGLQFWHPQDIAGDEDFYLELSAAWPNYYRTERWEYKKARRAIKGYANILEIGCGKGYFLRSIEGKVGNAAGIELNRDAAMGSVTRFPIHSTRIESFNLDDTLNFDAICSFQVLEHITCAGTFLRSACKRLTQGGLLIISTPNNDYEPHRLQTDAFDLPPHHMNHFKLTTFERISEELGLDIVDIIQEPRHHAPEPVTKTTAKSFGYKLAKALAGALYNMIYRIKREPGPSILVIMRKR